MDTGKINTFFNYLQLDGFREGKIKYYLEKIMGNYCVVEVLALKKPVNKFFKDSASIS